jgi:hypothetical protein
MPPQAVHRPLPELAAELAVVAGDRGAAPEREVIGGDGVDRRAEAGRQDQTAVVDRRVEPSPIGPLRAGAERQQRRVALKVRRGAGRRGGQVDSPPPVQPVAGQAVGEDLVGVQRFSTSAAISAAAFFASSNSIEVFSS